MTQKFDMFPHMTKEDKKEAVRKISKYIATRRIHHNIRDRRDDDLVFYPHDISEETGVDYRFVLSWMGFLVRKDMLEWNEFVDRINR